MSADIIPIPRKPPDMLCEAHPGVTAASTTAVSATVASTAVTLTAPQVTHLSTAPEHLRKPKMRMVSAAAEKLGWPNGLPPAWLSRKQRILMIQNACREEVVVISGPDGGKVKNAVPHVRTIDRFFTGK